VFEHRREERFDLVAVRYHVAKGLLVARGKKKGLRFYLA